MKNFNAYPLKLSILLLCLLGLNSCGKTEPDDATSSEAKPKTQKAAIAEFRSSRMELELKASQLPEILSAQKELDRISEQQTFVICDVVAESGPEGKKMADNVRDLLLKLQARKN